MKTCKFPPEIIINNLFIELDSLTSRTRNIKQSYKNTSNKGLKERLMFENIRIQDRINEIFSSARLIEKSTKKKISFSSLLIEKCKRSINETNLKEDLFFN